MSRLCARCCLALLLAASACSKSSTDTPGAGTVPGVKGGTGGTVSGGTGGTGGASVTPDMPDVGPFVALAPNIYGAKVKTLLTGLPLTDAELAQLNASPDALAQLIDGWMALPQWRDRMLDFFKQSFQQTQTDINDYDEELGRTTNPWNNVDKVKFVRSAEESFARTALDIVLNKRPFTEVLTTDRIMLNPPLMSSYAAIDAMPQNDMDKPAVTAWWLRQKFPNAVFIRTANIDPTTMVSTPIPFEDSINPASPNFFKFYDPTPYKGMNAKCADPEMRMGVNAFSYLADFVYGGRPGCGSTKSQFTDADWDSWRMVTIRAPKPGEERTIFWDLPKLRQPTTDLVLNTPRVGFMTTLAFFANWPTHNSNSYRVTTNQTLIVALGRSFDDRGTTIQVSESSSDAMHVKPGTPCYGCHQTLDPMRDFFRQSFSVSYSSQLLAGLPPVATFTVDGSPPVMGTGVAALGQAMAKNPRFAVAWAQKLCQFANASDCDEEDPEVVRVADAFTASNFNFQTLVRTMFSSPLVTFAKQTKSEMETGVAIGITRRETLCAALSQRLGLPDVCGIQQATPGVKNLVLNTERNLALSIPGGGYARGDVSPLLPHDPSMFFSSATENLCSLLATNLVDKPGTKFQTLQKDAAIKELVTALMGLPSTDPRTADMTAILTDHFTQAQASGVSAADAMRSTFTLACESPLAVSLGL
jgi:hypothetical protein